VRQLTTIACTVLSLQAAAAANTVSDIAIRLERDGTVATNAYLSAHWESAMAAFSQAVERCDVKAMQLALQLRRGTNAETAQAHSESLSIAVGRCPVRLLPLVPVSEVAQFCSAANVVSESRVQSELTRRIRGIEANASLRASQNGRTCLSAYHEEARRAALGPWQSNDAIGRSAR
jgi:hypothetical protein